VLSGAYIVGTNPSVNAVCTPVLGGSGTGQFYVMVGGVDTSLATFSGTPVVGGPVYLQEYGPYTFTSTPGAPAAIKLLTGNNQAVAPAQYLSAMTAEVVDAKGNAVQNALVTWTVTPASAVALNWTTTTDNNGTVTATGNFSGVAAGNVTITVALASNPSISATFTELAVVPVASMTKISGDVQTAKVTNSFALPLVVQLNGGGGPLANYPVRFSVSGPAVLSSATAVTNSSGQAQITVTAGSTTGTVTVTASVGTLSQAFTLTVAPAGPTPNGMTKVSGDGQGAVINTNFASPLVVQVNSTSGPVSNYTVQFSTSSSLIALSAASAVTNSAGQAQVTVTAGSVTGVATVTASIAGYSVSFNLTVSPPGPVITAASFANAASGQAGFISPCGLATITAAGLAPNGASSLFPAPVFGPLPTTVNGISVDFNNYYAPIISETLVSGQPQLLVQVPCEVAPAASVPVTVNVGAGSSTVNVPVQAVAPGIFQTTYSDGVVRAVALRSDGSFVSLNPYNPARRGEIVRVYVTGLGPTIPNVGTGQVDNPGADLLGEDAVATGQVSVGISQVGGATVTSARLGANMIGVFEVAFIIPANAPQGNNVAISVGVVPSGTSTAVNSLNSQLPIQ
jgi:uncharacterized protein (TIGR03437 family)